MIYYGIQLWAAGIGEPRTLVDLAQLAEEAGWDGFFLEDFITHWHGRETYDPWFALVAMAMPTTHIRLGAIVTALPRRRPWKLAREVLTLDHLSNGRMILGGRMRRPDWDQERPISGPWWMPAPPGGSSSWSRPIWT